MKRKIDRKKIWIFLGVLICLLTLGEMASATDKKEFASPSNQIVDMNGKRYIVGTKNFPLFSKRDEKGNYSGYSINFWNKITDDVNFHNWDYKHYETLDAMMNDILTGKIDFAISAISKNYDRIQKGFKFLETYFISRLCILTYLLGGSKGVIANFKEACKFKYTRTIPQNILSVAFIEVCMLFMTVIFVWSHIYYLWKGIGGCDSRISKNYFLGVSQSFYYTFVYNSTIGFGDYSLSIFNPEVKKLTFDMFISIKMFIITALIGMALTSLLVGIICANSIIASSQSEIKNSSDLCGKNITVINKASSIDACQRFYPIFHLVDTYNKLYEKFKNREVNAAVHDYGVIYNLYLKAKSEGLRVAIIEGSQEEYYSVVVREGLLKEKPELIKKLNNKIIELRAGKTRDYLQWAYFPEQ